MNISRVFIFVNVPANVNVPAKFYPPVLYEWEQTRTDTLIDTNQQSC